MTKKTATEEALEDLHSALARQLAERIKDGTATAADLSVARQFLKDNGIDAQPREGSPTDDLRNALPFPSADSIADDDHLLN